MHRVTQCRASRDYRLWLKFEDGLEGSVFLGNLLEVRTFRAWRDVNQFCRVAVDRAASTVVWDAGIRLDPDILYQDLLSSVGRKAGRIQIRGGTRPGRLNTRAWTGGLVCWFP